MGTPYSKEVGHAFSLRAPPNKRQRLRDGPKTEPAPGDSSWGGDGTLFSQGSGGRVTYFPRGLGQATKAGEESVEKGVSLNSDMSMSVSSSVSSSMGTEASSSHPGACASKACHRPTTNGEGKPNGHR